MTSPLFDTIAYDNNKIDKLCVRFYPDSKEEIKQLNHNPQKQINLTLNFTPLYLYKITANYDDSDVLWLDQYDTAIVIAKNEDEAKTIHPGWGKIYDKSEKVWDDEDEYNFDTLTWALTSDYVIVKKIGTYELPYPIGKPGVVLSSSITF